MVESKSPSNPDVVGAGGTWALLLSSSLTVMGGAVVAPALPRIHQAFAGDWQSLLLTKLVLTLPALAIAVAAPGGGRILARFGKRRVLLAGLLLFTVAGTTGLWLPREATLGALLVGRIGLGLGIAAVMVSATTLIGDYFEGDRLRLVLGRQAAVMAGGGVVFLIAGGLLADLSWRAPFAVYFVSLLLVPPVLRLPVPGRREAMTASVSSTPAAPLRPVFVAAFLLMAAFYVVPTQLPFLLEHFVPESGVGTGALGGLAIAASTATAVVAGLRYRRLRSRHDNRAIVSRTGGLMAIGLGAAAIAPVVASWGLGWQPAYGLVLGGMLVLGFGTGLVMPNLNDWLMGRAAEETRGAAVGRLTSALFAGQFASPILVAPLVSLFGLPVAFGVVAALLAVSALRVPAAAK